MIKIDKSEIIEGCTVFWDDESDITYYVLPNTPSFRFEKGIPIFQFYKYKFPITRPDGKIGGGMAFFDVEFVVPDETMAKVKAQLQERVNKIYANSGRPAPPVKIGQLTFTKGKASINMEKISAGWIEKVYNPGSPSLYGKYITPFTIEFTQEGATFFADAMKGMGGTVQVAYDLWTFARLPPIKVKASWNQHKFYQFFQTIDVDWNLWSDDNYTETVRETIHNHESYDMQIDPGGITDPKVMSQIRDAVQRNFDDAIARNLLKEATPVSDENRKLPEGIEHVTRDIVKDQNAYVSVNYTEKTTIEWNPQPGGTLPSLTNYPNVKLENHFHEIDLNDPFFQNITVAIMVNADFEKLPIHSIEAHFEYKQGNTTTIEEPIFRNSNDVAKFKTYIENNINKYKYWYQVNYKGESQVFKSKEVETDEKSLVINVDDTGILLIDVAAGDLDFDKVKSAQVTLQYEDNNVPLIEKQLTMDKNNKVFKIAELIFQPRRNKYKYWVKYNMADGRTFQGDPIWGQSNQLYISSPFSATKTIGVRSLGDMEKDISTIYLDLKYDDSKNDYIVNQSIALTKSLPFFDWSFPVLSAGGGKVTYSGTIKYMDGTSEDIPETEEKASTISIGEIQDFLEVQLVPDLIDFNMVKLVKVSLSYKDKKIDTATGQVVYDIDENKDLIVKSGSTTLPVWTVKIKDKTKKSYMWQATFFMKDGSTKKTESLTTSEPTIVLEVPK